MKIYQNQGPQQQMEAREIFSEVLYLTSHIQLVLRIGYVKLYHHIPYMPL